MYFLIGVWGGARRIYAAVKFFLFTMAGSIFMMAGILYLANAAGSFSLLELAANRAAFAGAGLWLFLAFGWRLPSRCPCSPAHLAADAHVEAPTAGSVILAAVL
jgi:NADH-quinone oxidoreductase subunit M